MRGRAPAMLRCERDSRVRPARAVFGHGVGRDVGKRMGRNLLQVLKRIEAAGVCNLVGLMINRRGGD